jgi:hypothetical protein
LLVGWPLGNDAVGHGQDSMLDKVNGFDARPFHEPQGEKPRPNSTENNKEPAAKLATGSRNVSLRLP